MATAEVKGLERVVEALRHYGRRHRSVRYVVGFSAPYSVYVHEDLRATHRTGRAKFLEAPARTKGNEIAAKCRQVIKAGGDLEQGLLASANHLKDLAQALTPVDTGELQRSAYVRKEAT